MKTLTINILHKFAKPIALILAIFFSCYAYSQNNFPATGNVAIGTTSPQNTLEVGGSGARFTGAFTETTSNTGIHVGISGTPRIGLFNGTTSQNWQIDNASGTLRWFLPGITHMELSTNGLNLVSTTTGVLRANGSDNSYFLGNVGIGTMNPDAKLAVNGTIHTKEIKVDMNDWPDYVFHPQYNLPKLSELRSYIAKNRHLPDLPSEQEVKSNGLNLGEIITLQMKKIEELTLYIIQHEQRYEEQNVRLVNLETELAKTKSNR